DLRAEDLGITNLDRVFRGLRVVGLGCKVELPDTAVVLSVAEILVARRERVVLSDLVVEARAEVGAVARVGDYISKRDGGIDVGGIEDDGVNGSKIVDIPSLEIEEKRGLLAQRSADVSVVLRRIVTWLWTREGIGGIESRIIAFDKKLAMIFVGAWLGKDFNAAISQLVVFRGKWILINPDLADGRLGRQLAGGESINVHLATVGSSGGPGERFEIGLQLIRIVG